MNQQIILATLAGPDLRSMALCPERVAAVFTLHLLHSCFETTATELCPRFIRKESFVAFIASSDHNYLSINE